MANLEWDKSGGWDLPSDFEMPTTREIEFDLAMGSESWQSLLVSSRPSSAPPPSPLADHHAVPGARRRRRKARLQGARVARIRRLPTAYGVPE